MDNTNTNNNNNNSTNQLNLMNRNNNNNNNNNMNTNENINPRSVFMKRSSTLYPESSKTGMDMQGLQAMSDQFVKVSKSGKSSQKSSPQQRATIHGNSIPSYPTNNTQHNTGNLSMDPIMESSNPPTGFGNIYTAFFFYLFFIFIFIFFFF